MLNQLFTSQKHRYKRVIDNSDHFVAIDIKALQELFEKGSDNFVYIGRPTCDTCRLFIPLLNHVLNDMNLTIYYFDTDAYIKAEYKNFFDSVNIKSLPSLLKLNGNNQYQRMKVYHPESAIKMWMTSQIK